MLLMASGYVGDVYSDLVTGTQSLCARNLDSLLWSNSCHL